MIHRQLLQLAGTVRGAILALAAVGLALSALHVAFAVLVGLVVAALVRGDGDVGAGDIGPPLTALAVVALVRAVVIWDASRWPPASARRCASGCAAGCWRRLLPSPRQNAAPGGPPRR